jgi:AraC-type DNA-binding domain-containing proteins
MDQPARLDERAAPKHGPLWHLDAGRTCFVGPLTYNAPHQHGAPVFLAGLYGTFRLRLAGGGWCSCRTAVIPAGVVHELDVEGNPIGVLYIEPTVDGQSALASLVASGEQTDGVLLGRPGETLLLRALWEDAASVDWAGEALDDLLGFASAQARRHPDPRISRAIHAIGNSMDRRLGVEAVSALVGLSPHRFQHVFTRELGVPFRRYRSWMRMRDAIAAIADGSNFTQAAHAAGFCDQAHFTRDFRRTFGAAPSLSLSGVRVSGGKKRIA